MKDSLLCGLIGAGIQRSLFPALQQQLPLPMVAARARQSVKWITGLVSRRSLPAHRIIRTVGR